MNVIEQLQEQIIKFRDERNWAQYHTPKELAACLSVEAGELLEVFLWKKTEDIDQGRVKEELADVFYSALLLAKQYDLDVVQIVMDKLEKNREKYPVEESWGSCRKWDE